MRTYDSTMDADPVVTSDYKTTLNPVSVSDIGEFEIKVAIGGSCSYIFYDADGQSLTTSDNVVGASNEANSKNIIVPENAAYVHLNFSFANDCTIEDYQIFAA